jgi:predicted protein tyrosine phosphatase
MTPHNEHATNRHRPMQGAIHVCPLIAVPDTVAESKASHLLTWVQEEIPVETPPLITPDRHLRFHIHDIAEPIDGHIAPAAEHIEQLIAFARDWAGEGSIVVHCRAAISRSPAAAYIALCAINPDVSEELIAQRLRAASPTAYPNRLMIRLGDAALGRQGRMVRAVESIGRGEITAQAKAFSLPAEHADPVGISVGGIGGGVGVPGPTDSVLA